MPELGTAPLHRRGIKSYVIRAGRMTQAQQRGLEDVWPRLGLTIADGRQDLDALFGRQAPRVVEIGFGMGNSLIEQAETYPDTDFIGIEVHAPGVGKLLDEVDKRGLTNLRVYREDALAVLEQCLPLYTLLAALGNPTVHWFILDIEGAELQVLPPIMITWSRCCVRC